MKLSGSDVLVTAAALICAAALAVLFVADLEAGGSRSGGRKLGTVAFRKLSATRRAADGFGWARMRNDGPIYDADTLRTAGFSEATVFFDDGTSLDMLENSMVKLDFGSPERSLEFLAGEIGVGSADEAVSYTISSAAGSIRVEKGAKAVFAREEGTLSVEVSRGSAALVRSDGSTQTVAQNQELRVDLRSGAAAIAERPVVPVAPERNGRLLSFAGGQKAAIDFAWLQEAARSAGRKAPEKNSYVLELSRSKDFEPMESAVRVDGLTCRVELEAGTWYWRARGADGAESPTRKFSLTLAEAPRPTYPQEESRYEYRRIPPEIAFAWTPSEGATGYLLEVAGDPGFAAPAVRARTSTTGLSVRTLGEGAWYWRVSPIHSFTLAGTAPEVRARSFSIAKRARMAAPSPTAPFDKCLYQIQDIDGKGLDFSWAPEPEAVSYELVVSESGDLSSPVLLLTTKKPYLRLSGDLAGVLKIPGRYFWGVRWIDDEGNASPPSPGRSLSGIDGSVAMRLSFPPDGYRIADSLVRNTRFSWKTNVDARTVFQLSRDAGFQDPEYQETVEADTLIGRQWKNGKHFWRLCAYNADGSIFLKTEPRSFEVVEPFAGPSLASPAPGSSFYIRRKDSAVFSWAPIAHADYYNLALRSAADGYAAPVYERDYLEEPRLEYALGSLPGGTYRLSVQAFAASGEDTTRIIGYIGDSGFSFKPLSDIELRSPAEGEQLDGLAARRGKIVFEYDSADRPDAAELIVSRDPEGAYPVARAADRSGRASAGRLAPGSYYWTVRGTLAGFDISAAERRRFTVDQPPLLPAPEAISPAKDSTIGPDELRRRRAIDFAWKPVDGATLYRFAVYAPGKREPIVRKELTKATEYTIDDLTILEKGRLTWTVEAQAVDEQGEIEQAGRPAESAFTIDLPAVKKVGAGAGGKLYGR